MKGIKTYTRRNRKRRQSSTVRALDLEGKVSAQGGPTGFGLEVSIDQQQLEGRENNGGIDTNISENNRDHYGRHNLHYQSAGVYGERKATRNSEDLMRRARSFSASAGASTSTPSTITKSRSRSKSCSHRERTAKPSATASHRTSRGKSAEASLRSRYSRATAIAGSSVTARPVAVHIVCAISENLARETCVASLDAGAPTSLQVTKQGNSQTYAETVAYLEILKPNEILLNEGRRNSQLARKILELYKITDTAPELPINRPPPAAATNRNMQRRKRFLGNDGQQRQSNNGGGQDEDEQQQQHISDRFGALGTPTIVKFISRACFDQTKGAELLRRISQEESYDATVVEEYILLSSAHALLHYTQQSLGAFFSKNCLHLSINAGGNNRMAIDRSTLVQLELLANSKTGKVRDSLIGSFDCTKTTVGSRLLRTNLMSPPKRVDTINSRLELVDAFLADEEFFYMVFEHLSSLPDVDKMLSNIVLVPKKTQQRNNSRIKQRNDSVALRIAHKGISALVYIKSVLSALPSFAGALGRFLKKQDSPVPEGTTANQGESLTNGENSGCDEDLISAVTNDRTSLMVGLGGGDSTSIRFPRNHLLRAIKASMVQPALREVLDVVNGVCLESTTFSRNAHTMQHQECFAIKCPPDGLMSVLRKAFLQNVDEIYMKADEYAERYGLRVSVKYTTSRGYFLAVPLEVGEDLPEEFLQPARSGRFINCTTDEVSSLNIRARDNVEDLLLMTNDRIQEVLDFVRKQYDALASLCDAIAICDMCHSFADNVTLNVQPWCRPVVFERHPRAALGVGSNNDSVSLDIGLSLIIKNGRYGIDITNTGLSNGMGPEEFIPNDTFATDDKHFTLVTGINGSGKSTYLKQIAIIAILAHCGSYVPAEQASVPLRDRICTRIGICDDQEHNLSTFMLEMKETAFICNNATDKSLILVDELGRATSNEDGVAIAWAVAEYLMKKRAMTFFVTHYPQLTRLGNIYPSVQNVHLEASISRGEAGDVSYTHKVKPGVCSVSTDYGVELSAACGWPIDVVNEARDLRGQIESLLPDQSLCESSQSTNENGNNNHDSISQVHVFDSFRSLRRELKSIITRDEPQSFAAIRSELKSLIPRSNVELISQMESLLGCSSHGMGASSQQWPAVRESYSPPDLGNQAREGLQRHHSPRESLSLANADNQCESEQQEVEDASPRGSCQSDDNGSNLLSRPCFADEYSSSESSSDTSSISSSGSSSSSSSDDDDGAS